MKRTFDSIVLGYDGKALFGDKGTIRDVVVSALSTQELEVDGAEKFKRHILADRIYGAGSNAVEVSPEELTLIKRLVGKGYAVPVVGFVYRHLDADPDRLEETLHREP